MTPTFGIFDHIEDIPGTSTRRILQDRLALVKDADEAGFTSFDLAEHHGSGLCLAPTQEIFIAAASQITKTIRFGPMVKLLPLHHPLRILEDMCVTDQLTGGRLDFGVGRGVAPIEHAWFGSRWTESKERFEDALGIICSAFATGEISSEGSATTTSRPSRSPTKPAEPIPFWYPGNPIVAGRHGMSLSAPAPFRRATYDAYPRAGRSTGAAGSGSTARTAGARRLGDDRRDRPHREGGARDLAPRRRRADAAESTSTPRPPRALRSRVRAGDQAAEPHPRLDRGGDHRGAGVPEQIAERFAGVLEPGYVDHIALRVPTGDITYDEARRTVDLFGAAVMPVLEKQFAG